jgi:hypothetical protein
MDRIDANLGVAATNLPGPIDGDRVLNQTRRQYYQTSFRRQLNTEIPVALFVS